VVYGIDEDRKHVLIVLVIPGSISIAQKKAELIKRFEATKTSAPPAKTPIGSWADFTS